MKILNFAFGIVAALSLCAYSIEAAAPVALSQDQFGSLLSLDEAVGRALKGEAEVKRAWARLQKEESLYKGSLAEFLPRLKGELFQAMASGEKKFVSFMDAGIELPIFQGGKNIAGKRKHKARLGIETLQFEEAKLDIELGVRILYVQVLEEKDLTMLAQGQVKELNTSYERIKTLVDKEVLPRYELFRFETMLQKAKYALVKHKETYDHLLTVLRDVVRLKDGESLDLEPLPVFSELEEDVTSYLEAARRHAPLYKRQDLKIKERTFEKKELQADRFPHLSLTAKWNSSRDIYVNTDRAMVGIMGTWNIWDFGRLGSAINAKSYEIEETKWKGQIEIRENEKEIRKLFHEARTAREKIKLAEAVSLERQEIFKNEKTRLIAGEKGAGELTDSFIALEEAKIVRIQAIAEYRTLLERLARKAAFQGPVGLSADAPVVDGKETE